jgi:hypothetical protein
MEAFTVIYRNPQGYDVNVTVFAISASSAIRKVCRKFKLTEQRISSCSHLTSRIAI